MSDRLGDRVPSRKPAYLVTGDEFLADEALASIRAEAAIDPLSEVSFDAGAEPAEIATALTISSLLGGHRLVVVRDAHELRRDQNDAIAAWLEQPSPDCTLVLLASGRSRLEPAVKKVGEVLTLQPPKGRRLVGWVRARARRTGLELDDRSAWALIDWVGGELRDLDGALVQLVTAQGRGALVTAAEIRRILPRRADERIFVLTDAVGGRRLPEAMVALRRLLDQGDEPLIVFGAMSAHVRRLLVARRAAERGPREVADVLGLPSWRAERITQQARSYTESELAAAVTALTQADVDLKGDVPPEGRLAVLERLVVQVITGVAAPEQPELIVG